jgi:hypothetical protein
VVGPARAQPVLTAPLRQVAGWLLWRWFRASRLVSGFEVGFGLRGSAGARTAALGSHPSASRAASQPPPPRPPPPHPPHPPAGLLLQHADGAVGLGAAAWLHWRRGQGGGAAAPRRVGGGPGHLLGRGQVPRRAHLLLQQREPGQRVDDAGGGACLARGGGGGRALLPF